MGTRRCMQVVILVLVATLVEPAFAGVTLARQQWQDYDWPRASSGDAQPVTRSRTSVDWVWDGGPASPEFHYDYQPLRIRSGDPAHNGHLHRVAVGLTQTLGQWQLQGRIGLHGTSNIFKYREPHREALVGSLEVWRELEDTSVQAIGIGGDHRFGHFLWVPRLLWEQSVAGHELRLDLPRGFYWKGPRRRWRFQAERVGDKWGALDAERDFKSAIYLQEWQLVIARRVPVFRGKSFLEVGLGMSLDTRVRYREADRREVTRDFGNAGFGLVQLRW